ncbi:hypothetical protein [Nocardia sputorum]|uniref:hypothetical protein n=1 Tax=Nocardia sputorum TaxID=2984338 RepID=UPI002493B3BA|nr:hypothetical protein [Nocardia sputorum]
MSATWPFMDRSSNSTSMASWLQIWARIARVRRRGGAVVERDDGKAVEKTGGDVEGVVTELGWGQVGEFRPFPRR